MHPGARATSVAAPTNNASPARKAIQSTIANARVARWPVLRDPADVHLRALAIPTRLPSRVAALAIALAGAGLAACGQGARSLPATNVDAPVALPSSSATAGRALRARPGLMATVIGPRLAPYQASAGGLGGYHALVRLTNASAAPANVERFRVEFAATREGVAFPCREHRGGEARVREPKSLGPGESFLYKNATSTAGQRCSVATTSSRKCRSAISRPSSAAPSPSESSAPALRRRGHPYPGRPALHVALVGDMLVRGTTTAAWLKGAVSPVVVLTNAGGGMSALARCGSRGARAAEQRRRLNPLRGRGQGSRAPPGARVVCARPLGRSSVSLQPGRSHHISVPLKCGPAPDGDYRVEGYVVLGDGAIADGCPVGPLPLKVSRDPALVAPVAP